METKEKKKSSSSTFKIIHKTLIYHEYVSVFFYLCIVNHKILKNEYGR